MNRQKTEKVTVTRSLLQRFAAAPYTVWAVLFIVIPLIFVAYYAFTDRDFAFTLDNIKAFFTPKYMTILWRSVKLAVIATVICLIIGYPAAYFIARTDPKKAEDPDNAPHASHVDELPHQNLCVDGPAPGHRGHKQPSHLDRA